MEMNGWIKLRRKELGWLNELTDSEMRYYIASRINADWDFRHKTFGTFDVRTRIVKETMPKEHWSEGKINGIKKALLNRGLYKKTNDPWRLKLTNADLFLKRSRKYEEIIRGSEKNLHYSEYNIQWIESTLVDVARMRADLARSKRVFHEKDSAH